MSHFIKRIQDHNYLNGFWFVTVEFLLFIAVLLPFTVYYFVHGKFLFGWIGTGWIGNFITVILFSVRSILRRETSLGIGALYSKKVKDEISRKYPGLTRDTMLLVVVLGVPYLLVCLVGREKWLWQKRGNDTTG